MAYWPPVRPEPASFFGALSCPADGGSRLDAFGGRLRRFAAVLLVVIALYLLALVTLLLPKSTTENQA